MKAMLKKSPLLTSVICFLSIMLLVSETRAQEFIPGAAITIDLPGKKWELSETLHQDGRFLYLFRREPLTNEKDENVIPTISVTVDDIQPDMDIIGYTAQKRINHMLSTNASGLEIQEVLTPESNILTIDFAIGYRVTYVDKYGEHTIYLVHGINNGKGFELVCDVLSELFDELDTEFRTVLGSIQNVSAEEDANEETFLYPTIRKEKHTDTIFGEVIEDDYHWLENPGNREIQLWIDAQNRFTGKALRKPSNKINSYVLIDKYSFVKYNNPQKEGDYYFTYAYYNNMSVPALFYQKSLKSDPSIIVDPSFISARDNIMLRGYSVSGDSKLLAYQFSRNGSDWGEIKVVNLKSGNHKDDHLTGVKFSGISWKDDGFYYSRFSKNDDDEWCQQVYYHKTGTPQEADELIFKRDNPDILFDVMTTADERYLIIHEQNQTTASGNVFYIDFLSEMPALRPLITRLSADENLTILDNSGDLIFATSFRDNNNGMILAVDPASPRQWNVVIPEYESSLLLDVKLLDDKIIALYQSNRKQMITFYDYEGELLEALQLPFGFSADGFSGEKSDKEILLSYSSYTQPPVVYILNTETFKMKPLRATVVNFDYKQFETAELEYESFDGTKVPMFMIYKKGLDLSDGNPLLLEAYGGFGSIVKPTFSPGIVHFLLKGGVYAFANIRGGGDKGKAWALAGRGEHKQNSFNDFIAAAEYLIEQNYTSPEKLAITGASNGGLVVAVAMTRRPDLFKVAVPVVAPFDMLRFESFTVGRYHTDEYGSVKDSAGFTRLLDYSPYHHIDPETGYPATLIMTSENDDRVPPFHSYKFAAKLQNNPAQKNPVLLRVEEGAGHYGATSGFKKHLRSEAAMYDFILFHLLDE